MLEMDISPPHEIFTKSGTRPIQSSICSVHGSVCLSVSLRLIVDYAKTIRVSVFFHTIYYIFTFFFFAYFCSQLKKSKVKLINYKKIPWGKVMKEHRSQNLQFWPEMVINYRINVWVFVTHCWWVKVKISSKILLCILGELAGGGSVAVAVGVSDIWQVTGDMQNGTRDTWHMIHDMWLKIKEISLFFKLALLSAHIEKFSVSRMRNFSSIKPI